MQVIERRISFNGGEISPWTDPRLDLSKYGMSCRTCENMRPTVYGGAFSRAGTIYIAEQESMASIGRVVPFEFSATTNLALVFSDELMRPWTTGTTPAIPQVTSAEADIWTVATGYAKGAFVRNLAGPFVGIWYCTAAHTSSGVGFSVDHALGRWEQTTDFKLPTPYQPDELAELQFAQINDLVHITHPDHAPQVMSRYGNADWTLADLDLEYPPLRDQNRTTVTITANAVTGSVTLLATGNIFNILHIGSRWVIKHRRDEPSEELAITAAVGTASPELFVLGAWSCSLVAGDGTGNWDVTAIVERSTDKSNWETIRTLSGSRQDQSGLITGTELEPAWLRIKKTTEAGTLPTNGKFKIEAVDPDHTGIVEITGYASAVQVTATVLFELGGTSSTERWSEAAWSDYRGWPRSVCIHDSRLFFGGNAAQPQTVWGSVIDDFGNFLTGADDDQALIFTLNQRANAIQWLVSQGELLIGTAGAEGPLGGRDSDKTITPSNAKAGKFTQTGSKFIQAVAAQDAVIFVQRSGRKLHEMAFTFESDGYKANDLTLLAEHVADTPVVGIALQKNPEPVLWAVTSGGVLLGLTYERSQTVAGWCRYVTDGAFESVAVVGGDGEEDEIWVTVRRTVDGNTVRYLERFQPTRWRLLKDATGDAMIENQSLVCCVDSAVIYDGAATDTITGLDHLEGLEVAVLQDGIPMDENPTVTGGEITLEFEATVVIVGIPFTATLEPTYFETGDPGSQSKIAWKNVNKVVVEFWKSLGCECSANGGETWEDFQFTEQGALMDQAQPLFSGIKEARPDCRSVRQLGVKLRQTQPLPLNVLSMHVHHEMNAMS